MEEKRMYETWQGQNGLMHTGMVCEKVNDFTVIECDHCKFKHVIPLPTAEELNTIYSHEYYTTEKPLYIERYLEDKAWWDGVYAGRYEVLEKNSGQSNGRILDVGSGPGLFLSMGKARGWDVKGVEPSAKAAEYSREILGLDIDEIFLTNSTAPSLGTFDAVNMGEVLEHLPDPAGMLDIAHGLLNNNGLLCLVVPNDFNPFQIILRDQLGFKPWWVAPPHHLNYFNHSSLQDLVERAGFDILHIESTFPIDMFLLMGQNYIENDELGKRMHGMRMNFESALVGSGASELISQMYAAFSKLGVGREVVLFAKKKSI